MLPKNSKISALSYNENWPKKDWQKISQRAAQLNGATSISVKHQHFQAYCEDEVKNISLWRLKIRKFVFFFTNNSPKRNWRPKTWNIIDCEPMVVLLQKSVKSDP